MRSLSVHLMISLCLIAIAVPVVAKDGIHATVHTAISAQTVDGSKLEVSWTLADEESGSPFNASTVFIRLIGPTGDSTEAFARHGAHPEGH